IGKIAASAAIRQYTPTGPRAGRSHRISASGMVTDGALMTLLVLPIGIFRMLEIPQRPAALHLGDGCEVVRWRRRSGRPLERPCIPGIAPGKLTQKVRPKQVANEN